MTVSNTRGTALITGASSGFGAIYADRLAKRGYDLILVARASERLVATADLIIATTGRRVVVLPADLTDAAQLAQVEDVLASDDQITMLVNNAGVGAIEPLLDAEVGKMTRMIALNVTALTCLTYAVAPAFVAQGHGTIVNVASSIVGVAPEDLNGVYGGTKAYVVAFSQSLRHELSAKGVRVQVVLPGATTTEFWDIAGTPLDRSAPERRAGVTIAEEIVDEALTGLDLGQFITIPSLRPNQSRLLRPAGDLPASMGRTLAETPLNYPLFG